MENNNNSKKRALNGNSKGASVAAAAGENDAKNNKNTNPHGIEKPKRFLTAYNFFFMHERAEFLKSHPDAKKDDGEEKDDNDDDTSRPWTQKKKRQHKKTHGKIDFSSLSKRVAAKWKGLPPAERLVFEDQAADDLARYRHELRMYKKMVAAEEKRQKARMAQATAVTLPVAPSTSSTTTTIGPSSVTVQQPVPGHKPLAVTEQKPLLSANHNAVLVPPATTNPVPPAATATTTVKEMECTSETKYCSTTPKNQNQFTDENIPAAPPPKENVHKAVSPTTPTRTTAEQLTTPTSNNNPTPKQTKNNKTTPLNFPTGKLYGRDREMSTILDAYRKSSDPTQSSAQIVMVTGFSGAGKSTLVQQIKKPITDMGGNFICGKFDNFRQMEPLSATIVAFAEFCTVVAMKDNQSLHQIRLSIQEKLGSETAFLATVIPSLRKITPIHSTEETIKVSGMEAQSRLKYCFQLFLRAIATPSQPLVLFLDDLQWADPLSLELIESLVTDAERKSFLIIGSYRDNEVDETHPLARQLCSIESKQVKITKIKVGDLSKEDTNELISDMITTPPHFTQSLSNVVYRKTSGNVLFILQFLSSICDEGLLFFAPESNHWQWDTALIESKNIAESSVELMLRKIMQLPEQTQSALKMVACLGYCCEGFVLSSIANGDGIANFGCSDLLSSVEFAVKEGLLNRVGDLKYKFAHDMIQSTAYSLIPEEERSNWHFWIGSQVWANKSASPEKALFIVVSQLNKGSTLMTDLDQKIQLARLNLQAAQKSQSFAAFVPAEFYLNTAIKLLDSNSWTEHYDLSLELYNSCAEAEYCTGSFDEMNRKLEAVFHHARCLDDKLVAFFTLIRALFAQGKGQQASEVGLLALSQLGEKFPTYSDIKSIIMVEYAKVKQMIAGKTDDDLLAMKAMDNTYKIAAMRFMGILSHTSFLANQEVFALIILRMVQTTLNHGICDDSAFTFASLGSLMSGVFNDINGAYRFGQVALCLLERSQSKKSLSSVYVAVFSFIHPWVDHYRGCIEPLKHAYEEGIKCGDLNYAITAATNVYSLSFLCGEELPKVEKLMRGYIRKMVEHKQEVYWKYALPFWRTVMTLMGESDDTVKLIGQSIDYEELLKESIAEKRVRATVSMYHLQSWFAYMFGNHELASRMVERKQSHAILHSMHFLSCNFLFIDGLVSISMVNQTSETKWKGLAQRSIEGMKRYARNPPINSQHKLLLLQAESSLANGDYQNAERSYNNAILFAGQNGFVQDQALAYERAGRFHLTQGNSDVASHYYDKAYNAYMKWGAKGKADHLRHLQLHMA